MMRYNNCFKVRRKASIFAFASFLGGMLSLSAIAMDPPEKEQQKTIITIHMNTPKKKQEKTIRFRPAGQTQPKSMQEIESFFQGTEENLDVKCDKYLPNSTTFENLAEVAKAYSSKGIPIKYNLKFSGYKGKALFADLYPVVKNSIISKLTIQVPEVPARAIDSFLQNLRGYEHLRVLKICGLDIIDNTPTLLCDAFPKLKNLHLESAYPRHLVSKNALSILTVGLEHLESLTLSFQSSPLFDLSQLKQHCSLTSLDLRDANLAEQDIMHLSHFPNLETFKLSGCHLNSLHVNSLQTLVPTYANLMHCDLSKNNLKTTDVQKLATALNFNSEVDWMKNQIQADSFFLDLRWQK